MHAIADSSNGRCDNDGATIDRHLDRRYELRFTELFNAGHSYIFPCDAAGSVDMDDLPERARNNYLFARGAVGWQFHAPVMCPIVEHGFERPTRTS